MFFIKNWMWFALPALAAAVLYFSQMDSMHSAALGVSQAQLKGETKRADDAEAAFAKAQELAVETATAHAKEIHDIAAVRSAAVTAKEGAAHAPGSDDHFSYSDAAYGFMRDGQGAPAGTGAKAASGVDR